MTLHKFPPFVRPNISNAPTDNMSFVSILQYVCALQSEAECSGDGSVSSADQVGVWREPEQQWGPGVQPVQPGARLDHLSHCHLQQPDQRTTLTGTDTCTHISRDVFCYRQTVRRRELLLRHVHRYILWTNNAKPSEHLLIHFSDSLLFCFKISEEKLVRPHQSLSDIRMPSSCK